MKKSIRVTAVFVTLALLALMVMLALSNKSILSPRVAAQKDRSMEEKRLRHEQRRRLHAVPEIVSATPSLRVVHAEIVPRGPSDDLLLLTLRNDSPKSITSFTICTRLDEYGFTAMTFNGPEEGDEVLAPYTEKTVDVSAGNVEPGKPLTLCAVMFSDETQEGVERVRESRKQSREEAKRRQPN